MNTNTVTDQRMVVISGVSRGLGRAMVNEFIDQGHTVFGCARSAGEMKLLSSTFKKPHDFQVVDVASDVSVAEWVKSILPNLGAPHLLINNAAVVNRDMVLWEVSSEDFSNVIDTNLKGTANMIRHFMPGMIAQKRGVIVNISSRWGRSSIAKMAPYCSTKWAIEGLTLALAQELPSSLCVVAINPGIINTAMLHKCIGNKAEAFPSAEEWAKKAVSLLLELGPKDNGRSFDLTTQCQAKSTVHGHARF